MAKGSEELACTIKECYPMIAFFICVPLCLGSNIVHIIKRFTPSDSMEDKISKIGQTVLGFIVCTIPMFFIIKGQCEKLPRNCNPGLGWLALILPTVLMCICLSSVMMGVFELAILSNTPKKDE